MRRPCGFYVVVSVLWFSSAQAQIATALHAEVEPRASANCTSGVKYDDGSFFDAYSSGTDLNAMVQKFTLPTGMTGLDQACVCLARASLGAPDMNYEVVIYNDDGPNGAPGTQIAAIPATALAIPVFGATQFYSVPCR